jgi:hypothetical protein
MAFLAVRYKDFISTKQTYQFPGPRPSGSNSDNYPKPLNTTNPIQWPRGLRRGPWALVRWIAGSNPSRGMDVCPWFFYVMCRYRPCDGLIARPGSPAVCRKIWLRSRINGGQGPLGL